MSTGASRLGGGNRRPSRGGGPVRADDDPKASSSQIGYINDLRVKHGLPALSAGEASALTRSQAGSDIQAWLAKPTPEPDVDVCPGGWDQDIWALALRFRDYGRHDGFELAAPMPSVYAMISDLVTRFDMRARAERAAYAQPDGCERRLLADDLAARCWYHWPPHRPADQAARNLTWQQMVAVIMAEFWSRIQDEYALSRLPQYFEEYGEAAMDHWRSLRIKASIDAQPPRERHGIQRASMAGASKEDA